MTRHLRNRYARQHSCAVLKDQELFEQTSCVCVRARARARVRACVPIIPSRNIGPLLVFFSICLFLAVCSICLDETEKKNISTPVVNQTPAIFSGSSVTQLSLLIAILPQRH
jgi:hypothetical protein